MGSIYNQSIQLIGTILIIYLFRKYIDRESFTSIGLSLKKPFKRDMLIGFLLGFGLIFTFFLLFLLTGLISVTSIQFPVSQLIILLVVFIIAAMQEELYSRGYMLLNTMHTIKNRYIALVIVSAFFAFMHIDNPNMSYIALFNLFLAGIFLGIYYIHKKNIWFPFGLHLGWNLTLGTVVGSNVSGFSLPSIIKIDILGSDLLTGGKFGFEGSIITTIFLLFITFMIDKKYKE